MPDDTDTNIETTTDATDEEPKAEPMSEVPPPPLDHHVIATTREGRRVPIWDSHHNRDTFTKEEAFATAERYAAKVKEYTYAAVSIVEYAWSDLVALTGDAIAKLDTDGADELTVSRMFNGGDIHEGGDGAAQFLAVDGAHEALTKARAVPSVEHEEKVAGAISEAVARAADRDAAKAKAEAEAAEAARIEAERVAAEEAAAEAARVAAAETEAARIAEEEAAAHRAQAELDAAEGGEAHASTEPPPVDGAHATDAGDAGDDKPPPME